VVHWGGGSSSLPPGLTGVTALSAGWNHALALKSDGTLAAWGGDVSGSVNAVNGMPGVYAFAAGEGFSVGLRWDDVTYTSRFGSGRNDQNQLNLGMEDARALSAGGAHGAALLRNGTVTGWGRNVEGQATSPAGLSGVRKVLAGGYYTIALKNDGTMTSWGAGFPGRPGLPPAPAGYGVVGDVSARGWHGLALTRALPALVVLMADGRALTPSSQLNLASAGVAGSEPVPLTILNEGAAPLTGISLSLGGFDPASFTVTQPAVNLAPGASSVCTLRFTPASADLKHAVLNIASNDPDAGPRGMDLFGETDHTPIQAWRRTFMGHAANAGTRANTADFDGDGVLNLFEFAFGSHPADRRGGRSLLQYTGSVNGGGTLNARGQPAILHQKAGNTATVRGLWMRRKDHAAAGLVYTPEFAANPASFTASSATPQVLASDMHYDVVAVTFPATVPGGVPRFFRVKVSIPNPD
jgi:hypothetical protein